MYGSTRAEELAVVTWPPEQVEAFLDMQFEAQHKHYRENYTDTSWDVILVNGEPAGRLYVGRWSDEIRIVDVALLPEFRGSGAGTLLVREILDEAAASGRFVSIHVEHMNPAMTLYRRLGFEPAGEAGPYVRMEWRDPRHPGVASRPPMG